MKRSNLILNLDAIVSKIVIARDKRCITCGTSKRLTCSHLFKRGRITTRWDLFNCNCQCDFCNSLHNSNTVPYDNWFINKYGREKFEELERISFQIAKYSTAQLEEKLKEFKRRY